MDELTISVIIADRPYRLTIKRDEEETIRRAANKINKTIKHYSENYAFNDKQDLLAMVALENTTNALRHEDKLIKSDETISAKLSEIDLILSDNLKIE
ncbi:MAG: cell division protein ZapA [Bacteroidetes bacterium]|nr:cell division protein ZapA [Bacteroidota bacterium]MBL7103337.1 cell division protein ZapA [Bacteroidales bacterium]